MDKNSSLNDKSLFGASSSRSIQRQQTYKIGSQTSRSHYTTSICENEKRSDNCKKIMTEFLEQIRNRQSTFQFLDQCNKQSQINYELLRILLGLKQNLLETTYSRKLASVVPFEKGVTINFDENKRILIKKQKNIFLLQLMILQERYNQIIWVSIINKQIHLNNQKSIKISELEAIIKQQKIEILYLKEQIEELKNDQNNFKIKSSKIMAEKHDKPNNQKNMIKQLKQKNIEFDNKAKNINQLIQIIKL